MATTDSKSTRFSCPSCGASIQYDPNRNSMYCTFCGHPIIDVRGIIEKQAAFDVRKQQMEAIRDHKAAMHQMDLEHEKKMAKSKAVSSAVGILVKILVPVLIILGVIVGFRIANNKYRLAGSTAYTEKAFSVTKDQLIREFTKLDTKTKGTYNLKASDWDYWTENQDEKYFTETYNRIYSGERRWLIYFYHDEVNNQSVPYDSGDPRVYYYLYIETDDKDRIIDCTLRVKKKNETTLSDGSLNGYFGTTLPGEIYSIVSRQKSSFVLSKFKAAEEAWLVDYTTDGDVRYLYRTKDDQIVYAMYVTYKK